MSVCHVLLGKKRFGYIFVYEAHTESIFVSIYMFAESMNALGAVIIILDDFVKAEILD
jgi:hypothetical protein